MNFNIFEKKHHYIGIHLNSHALKALQFNITSKKTEVAAYTNLSMPKGLVVNDDFTDHEAISDLIVRALDKPQYGKFNTNSVILSIPESKSFIRVIKMQNMKDSEIENAILFEAESYIPLPMDQVYYDWQVLNRKADGIEVLLIASPKSFVDNFISVVEKANLVISGIETEAQSVVRALVPQTVTEPILIADIDAFKTALIIVQNSALQFTSSVPIAGNVFTERFAKAIAKTPLEAEKLKRMIGLSNTVEYPNIKTQLVPVVSDFAAELKNILKFHYDHHETHINRVLLTGGGAKLQNIGEILEPMLSDYAPIKVTVANPLEHLPQFKDGGLDAYEALSFTTSIGLAMWEINQ